VDNPGPASPAGKSSNSRVTGDLGVKGVRLYEMPYFADFRGSLSFAEYPGQLPFAPKRYFLTYQVPSQEVRGEHAHRHCHQFLVCVAGNCSVIVDDGHHRAEMVLDRPTQGIYIPPMVWSVEYKHSPQTVLMVLASEVYQPEDYIRDYEHFLREKQNLSG